MGRPLKNKNYGDTSDAGPQFLLEVFINDATGFENGFIVKQTGASSYLVEGLTSSVQGRCVLVDNEPDSPGTCRLAVDPFEEAASATALISEVVSATAVLGTGGSADKVVSVGVVPTGFYITEPSVSFTGGAGSGAAAAANLVNGIVTTITVTNQGTGYTSAPTVTVDGDGEVTKVTVTDGGAGFGSIPNISFTGGTGTGATASATVVNGSVSTINVTGGGSGFTSAPTVVFTPIDEYARIVQQHVVKTFGGARYEWDLNEAADAIGEADIETA